MREKTGGTFMIDWPSAFDPKEVWRDFLREMRTLPQDAPEVCEAVEQAEKMLAGPDLQQRDIQPSSLDLVSAIVEGLRRATRDDTSKD